MQAVAPLLEPRHLPFARGVERFASERIRPLGASDDEAPESERAHEYLRLLREQGLLAISVPGDDGAIDLRAICLARERLAAASAFADVMLVMQGLGTAPVAFGAAPALRARVLAAAREGAPAAFALTEPEAGSDVFAMATRARRDGGSWVLDGEKTFISNAGIAAGFSLFARDEAATQQAGKTRLSAFWVPAETPGLEVEPLHTLSPHPIGTVRLHGCRVDDAQRLGESGGAAALAFGTLDRFRISVGAAALGLASRALEEVAAHVQRRRQFGQPLASFQLVAAAISDSVAELEAARLLVYRAAADTDHSPAPASGGKAVRAEAHRASAAKMLATETAFRIVDRSVQLFGGLGVTRGSVVERLYRDVRALRIYEGTSEIHRLLIAKEWLAARGNPSSET
ncbi:MAG: acyl-CoA dehydrogenase family protein [Planctomycetes bacterium]|nr:acyl-CoA dehydrogenase family protein [Planctomycetota bacterium]